MVLEGVAIHQKVAECKALRHPSDAKNSSREPPAAGGISRAEKTVVITKLASMKICIKNTAVAVLRNSSQ